MVGLPIVGPAKDAPQLLILFLQTIYNLVAAKKHLVWYDDDAMVDDDNDNDGAGDSDDDDSFPANYL